MQKNNKACCVIFYDNAKYDELAKLAHDSFVKFHANEVDVHFITPYNLDSYPIESYKNYPNIIGIVKYIRGYDVMVKYNYEKLIIVDVDTITCSRLDEFMDDTTDVLATLNYPLSEETQYWKTPKIKVSLDDGSVELDDVNLNAGIICINNPNALRKIIDLSIEHPTTFCEQSGLNELAWVDKSYEVKAIESPYQKSSVVYNARSKGVPRAEMISGAYLQNCYPNNIHGLPYDWLVNHKLLDGNESPIKRWYVKDKKLYTEDGKNIKCFHFIEAIGVQNVDKFNRLVKDFKFNWFNQDTIEFFINECNAEDFFKDTVKMKVQNKFKIIVPSYNNAQWVEYNIASILNQTYTNYEVLYINDASTDSTSKLVHNIVDGYENWKVIDNEKNMGAMHNYVEYTEDFCKNDSDIIIHLDGDDWFMDETVLQKLNDFYNANDCWMSYGGFLVWDGNGDGLDKPNPQSTPYPKFIHDNKLYRRDEWRASHLRTYKAFLFKSIDKTDLKSLIDNEYYWHAADLAFQFRSMEMCPSSKIGLVDFYTIVYNNSKENSIRTKERESQQNFKYETEIRNRKSYSEIVTETTQNVKKLPQVNVFSKDYYLEYNNIPTKFTYCYEQSDGEYDMTVLCDPAILDYLNGKITIKRDAPLVARLFEQREYFQRKLYNAVLNNHHKFDAVLTFDRELLKLIPNSVFLPPTEVTQFNMMPNPFGIAPYKSEMFDSYELPISAFQMYPKSKLVSAVVSAKAFLPGHVVRLNFINSIRNKIDLFGRGMGREIPSKLDALRDYMFSVSIENISCDDNYFSEKIIDCFLTGTIPIYHGCVNIGEFFDTRGILMFNTQDELDDIMNRLSPELYYNMQQYAVKNFEECFKWPLNNDMLYDMYYKKIIEGNIK